MADRFRCPLCGREGDVRGANSHMRYVHNMPDATKEDVKVLKETDKPVREVKDEEQLREMVESEELIGVADNAIVFRNEIIVTDEDIKERIADAMVERIGGVQVMDGRR